MIAILERKLPDNCSDSPIVVTHKGSTFQLVPTWILIVRDRIIGSWARSGKPALSSKCVTLAIERIVDSFGGREAFNSLVAQLIDFDYYRQWISEA